MNYKALITGYGFVGSGSDILVNYVIFNTSNNTVVLGGQAALTLGSALSTFTLKEFQTAGETQIITDAGTNGFTITHADFLWVCENFLTPEEVEASKGLVSSIIDGKSVGNTTLFTNNTGKDFLVTEYWINPTTITGLGTAPVINLGKTASAYNDVDSGISLAFASNAGKFSKRDALTNSVVVANGESLVIRVATAAILTTAYSFKVMVRGVYLN